MLGVHVSTFLEGRVLERGRGMWDLERPKQRMDWGSRGWPLTPVSSVRFLGLGVIFNLHGSPEWCALLFHTQRSAVPNVTT